MPICASPPDSASGDGNISEPRIDRIRSQELEQAFERFSNAVHTAATMTAAVLQDHIKATVPLIEEIMRQAMRVYQVSGAPYGDGEEGMLRWMRDVAELSRLQSQADRILQRHQDMSELREMLED